MEPFQVVLINQASCAVVNPTVLLMQVQSSLVKRECHYEFSTVLSRIHWGRIDVLAKWLKFFSAWLWKSWPSCPLYRIAIRCPRIRRMPKDWASGETPRKGVQIELELPTPPSRLLWSSTILLSGLLHLLYERPCCRLHLWFRYFCLQFTSLSRVCKDSALGACSQRNLSSKFVHFMHSCQMQVLMRILQVFSLCHLYHDKRI